MSARIELQCLQCGAIEGALEVVACSACGGPLRFAYEPGRTLTDDRFGRGLWRYWRWLPLGEPCDVVTLGEGGTPLLRSRAYRDRCVWLKDETRNPTGSHKDRALAVAINHARKLGKSVSIVVSAGSTGISNAAYAARAGMGSITVMAAATPDERAYPVFALGSRLVQVDAPIDDLIDAVEAAGRALGFYVASTTRRANPHQAEGPKTIAYEIVETLGRAPDWVVVPTGGGGTVAGLWRGFKDLEAMGVVDALPRLAAVVPADFNAIELAWREAIDDPATYRALDFTGRPPTVLTKLWHLHPPDGLEAALAVRESGGAVVSVTDEEGSEGARRIGHGDGLYVEPSSGVAAAAVDRLIAGGAIAPDEEVVALLCGSGHRETFVTHMRRPAVAAHCDLAELGALLAGMAATT
ncbi:MAG: pyridoxal-phosphate dependent enzyme [Rhodospirillaceae bacterium]|nr:pyridoxal-phosphate dependent enzyme [Rhodospirillaceae bacterium]